MRTKSKWLLLLLPLFYSCGLFKTRIVTKTDSIYIDKTKVVTERFVDTIVTIKPDTVEFSFRKPLSDTTFTLRKSGASVVVEYLNGIYYLKSITGQKSVPIKIYEKKVEYRNVYLKSRDKSVVAKSNFNYNYLFIFLIISIILLTLVLNQKIRTYVSSKIKLW